MVKKWKNEDDSDFHLEQMVDDSDIHRGKESRRVEYMSSVLGLRASRIFKWVCPEGNWIYEA